MHLISIGKVVPINSFRSSLTIQSHTAHSLDPSLSGVIRRVLQEGYMNEPFTHLNKRDLEVVQVWGCVQLRIT